MIQVLFFPRSRVHCKRLWSHALLLVAMAFVPPASALTMPDLHVYAEAFDDLSFPTSAELDTIAAGGLQPVAAGNAAGPPTLDGSVAAVSLAGSPGPEPIEVSTAQFGPSSAGTSSFGARGFFQGFSLAFTGDATGSADVTAIYGPTLVGATLAHARSGGSDLFFVGAVETGTGGQTSDTLLLSSAAGNAIAAGDPFVLDLVIDRRTKTATASVTVGGMEYVTGALALTQTSGPLDGASVGAVLHNTHGADDGLVVEVDHFEAYSAGPDTDGDGMADTEDNCLLVHNPPPGNCDTDGDGYGNHCDGDFDQDGVSDGADFDPTFLHDFYQTGTDGGTGTDMDCDGDVDGLDYNPYFLDRYENHGVPGPSGLSCAGAPPCS